MNDVRALHRKVQFYRLVSLVLVVLLAMLAIKLKRIAAQVGDFGDAGQVWAVDLDERVKDLEETKSDQADFSETYLSTPVGSVHLHVMGHLQTTPLHLHPASDELTVIASGTAHVTQAWGADGGVTTRTVDFPAGSVVASPRFLAHEWVNQSSSRLLFNVVFTAPRFSGNFYVHPDDPRILAAGPPSTITVDGAELTARSELAGRLRTLRVVDRWTVPTTMDQPVMAYVLEGTGSLGSLRLKPNVLVHIEHAGTLTLEATTPLALVLFDVTGNAL